ncbi:CoA-acylating methylmalonate-semialdehyde dehydrogenase [Saxibacter everestensis]|uniref:methylmalonate-semialdehyde dehydrogenase (CoA acylating) n=1 Tax=Saxibacter everestensis TaxID=2909229 RepID=A0ABY8QSP4_9MICO|nr:CoA-acylating methylmalonate-semialdehyde dehydrogenase [Brevibacteriaceae bacterium ZFBP1038]
MNVLKHYINGEYVGDAAASRTSPVFNPATGEQASQVLLASEQDVDTAVAAAQAALPAWRNTSLTKRTQIMFRFRALLDANRDRLAAAVTSEHGKVLSDAAGEVSRGLENVEFACGLPVHLKGGHSLQASTGVDVHELRQAVGVVAGITPFNFPVMVPLWMLSNAIACGNTFILKPSEKDPSAALIIAELLTEAGLPDGVFTVLHGDKVAVDGLLNHDDVKAVSFVGSTPIAQYVYSNGTAQGKRIQALGGAKNHMVVLPDADLNAAADAAISAAYGSAGERCMAVSVLVAVGDVADELVGKVQERIAKLSIGDGTDPASEMGPLVTAQHRDKVASYIDKGAAEGATVVVDGREQKFDGDGFFIGVSLLDNVKPGMAVYDEEIFGPVLAVVRAENYTDAVELINNNEFGNGVAIFTRDGGAARSFEADVEVGMVGVNVPIPVPVGWFSFGGWKKSLFGDSHMYGPEGVHFFTRTKVVTTRWPDPSTSVVDLGFPSND